MRAQDFAPLPERITFTVDVEDLAGAGARAGNGSPRYAAMTARILDFLAERGAVATFFVVGDVAARAGARARDRPARP